MKSHTQQVKIAMEKAALDRLLKKVKASNLSDYLASSRKKICPSTFDARLVCNVCALCAIFSAMRRGV